MIDVLLVILVFFISITTMEALRIDQDIPLPVAADAKSADKERGEVIVNVRWDAALKKARFNVNADKRPIESIEVLTTELTKAVEGAKANDQGRAGTRMSGS